ncbi:MAG: ABC transporter ATP-binding protein [Thermoflexales bacterium]|nr:ABC transporter ATP-binding protein [Thermoflexales bacterium]
MFSSCTTPRRELGAKHSGLGRAIRYLGRYRRLAAVVYISLVLSVAAQLALPQLVQRTMDAITRGISSSALELLSGPPRIVTSSPTADAEAALIAAGLGLVIFSVLRALFAFWQVYMAERLSQSVAFDLRNALFAKIQRLSFSYYDRAQTGQLMIRATDDVEKVRVFLGQGLMLAVQALLFVASILTILTFIDLNLVLLVWPALFAALFLFLGSDAIGQPLFNEAQKRLAALNTILQETLAGIKVVKAFARQREEQSRFELAAGALMRQQLAVSRISSFLLPSVILISNLGQAAVLYYGGKQILSGELSLGEWQKFSLYLIYLFSPLGMLSVIVGQMSQSAASAARVFEILDAQSDVDDKPGALSMPPIVGRVTFENVTFRYFDSSEPVLRHVSFEVQPGQMVALLGATGSGKTSIVNLLPRFYDASEGRVLIDGYDVRDVKIDSLRAQIGVVLQGTVLFSGTIRTNIAFGRPAASLDDVIAAAEMAAAHDFITSLPNGYDTFVGECGVTLSGGQKQRIAIARALLLRARILILDDSTSSVDAVAERRILHALDALMKDRTSFVIAQRMSTVLDADQILVLDKGEIVARGKHEELLEENLLYAEIYHSQLME